MQTDLDNQLWVEKYRPQSFQDLILEDKSKILGLTKFPESMPSFIFHSTKPGTGKTSSAKLIIKHLGCDFLKLNSSDDRGIDTVRSKISEFARSVSSTENIKRCVFLDEADGLTKVAQDSLRNLMEEYSSTTFFVMTANDLSKIIEPIQSRCTLINFEKPNKPDIIERINFICEQEQIAVTDAEVQDLVNHHYPDIRSMVKTLQNAKIENKPITIDKKEYDEFLKAVRGGNIDYIYNRTYSSDFDIYAFNRWMFSYCFNNLSNHPSIADVALCLAEVEKGYTIGCNAPIIFLANMVKISRLLK